ncbi:MAG: hypothetical protein KC493_08585 [Bacteriovoracaceae bacterium]|nr:hypothetical protein [Bacteriovoracaceae bacterium]
MKLVFLNVLIVIFCFQAQAEEWELLVEKNGIQVYGAKETKDGLIPFRSKATLNFPFERVLTVLLDANRKPEWSPQLKSTTVHQKISPTKYILSEYYNTPWPATDREFLMLGELHPEKDKFILTAKTHIDTKLAHPDHIQVDIRKLVVTIERAPEGKTHFEFIFLGDMKGWMPSWLVNLIQKKWPFKFIKRLNRQLEKDDIQPGQIYKDLDWREQKSK